MARVLTTVLLSAMSSTLVVLPTVSAPTAAARPVTASVRAVPLAGIDAAGLAESPAPDSEGRNRVGPLAVTGKVKTAPFSALGVTWAADAAVDDVVVQVRTRSARGWTNWTEVEVQPDAMPDPGTEERRSVRAGSDPLYVGPSEAVQVRVDAGGKVKPRDLKLALIDPGTSSADADATAAAGSRTLGGATAHAAEARPSYVSRAGWGADESLRSCTPSASSTIKGGILHTTATGNDYTAAQSPAVMRSMYAYHTRSRGWCDLGYNFVVDKFGTLFEGRYGGVDKAVLGSHTGGFNSYTFGVAMMGHHDYVAPSTAMLTTVQKVFAWKLGLYGRDATGTTQYTSAGSAKYPAGTVVTKPVISGHRDYSYKSCPGNLAYPLLPSIRSAVAARMQTKTATSLTLSTSPSTLTYGATTTLSGKLVTSSGAGLAGKPLKVYVRKRGATTWALLSGSLTTAANGTFSGTHRPLTNVDYSVRFPGDDRYAAASRDGRTDVAPAVSATLSHTSVPQGGVVTMTGTVTPAHAGQYVYRQARYPDGTWQTWATTTISSTGTYTFTINASEAQTYTYRVLKKTDGDHAAAVSPTITLRVY